MLPLWFIIICALFNVFIDRLTAREAGAERAIMIDSGQKIVPLLIVVGVLLLFVIAGLLYKTREDSEYGLTGRYTGRIGGGAAIASNWMSAASFLGIAGLIYLYGYAALAYVIGWTGGYVLLAGPACRTAAPFRQIYGAGLYRRALRILCGTADLGTDINHDHPDLQHCPVQGDRPDLRLAARH